MGRRTKDQAWRDAIGAKVTKLTPETVNKLKEAFAIDCTIKQACHYAEITEKTYYNWIEKNPLLLQEFDEMREKLPLKAKYNIASSIHKGNVPLSERYLSRKEPKEYSDTLRIEHSGDILNSKEKEIIAEFHQKLKENLKAKSLEKAKNENEL